jgi:hypothetical protein
MGEVKRFKIKKFDKAIQSIEERYHEDKAWLKRHQKLYTDSDFTWMYDDLLNMHEAISILRRYNK